MRVRHSRPLPRCFRRHPKARGLDILGEYDLQLSAGSRLRAKMLVFKTQRGMHLFWKRVIGHDLGHRARGAVNGLVYESVSFGGVPHGAREQRWLNCDPRYFCLIGLCKRHLSMEVVSHEAVHVGFAHAKRMRRNPWAELAKFHDEEEIAYPTGLAAAAINGALYDGGFYKQVLART